MLGLKVGMRVQWVSYETDGHPPRIVGRMGTVTDVLTGIGGKRTFSVLWDGTEQPESGMTPHNLRIMRSDTVPVSAEREQK